MNKPNRILSTIVFSVVGLVMAMPLSAQVAMEEIVVTAQKREQSIEDVPIAIAAYSGEQMREFGVEKSFDVATFTPGVHISGNLAGQNTQFSIRGVTQNDFNDIIESPNAVYLDQGYIAIAQAQTFAMFDIQRVEVLKGPQGTLFGRNATGGLVQYISNPPTFDKVDGYIDATLGYFDSPSDAKQGKVQGAIGGPLGEKVAGRVAFYYNKQDGYLKNIYPYGAFGAGSIVGGSNSPGAGAGADMGDDDTKALRGTLAFKPSDRTFINLSANYAKSKLATGPYQSKPTIGVFNGVGGVGELINVIDVAPGETRAGIASDGSDFGSDQANSGVFGFPYGRPVPGGDFFGYIDPDGEDFTTSGDFAFKDQGHTETWGVNLRIEQDLTDAIKFTSISDYKKYKKLLFIDVDSAPVNQLANYAGVDAMSFTQEFRLNGSTDKLNWVVGLFFLDIDTDSDNGLKAPANSLPALFGSTVFDPNGVLLYPGGTDIGVQATLKTKSYSIFGQADYDLTDQLTLTAGFRYIIEDKDYKMRQGFWVNQGNFSVNVGEPYISIRRDFLGLDDYYSASRSDPLWAGKLQLSWKPDDDTLVYAGVNRGVKAASYNAPLPGGLGVPDSFLPYKAEVLYTLEGGIKKTLAGGKARISLDGFYYDYKDYQTFLFTGVGGVVINSDAENYGAEFQVQASPADGWDVMFGASWYHATVKDVPLRINSPLPTRDVKPNYAPEFQAMGMLRYSWDALGGRMAVMADADYSADYYYNLRNFDADKFDSYTEVNLRWSWASADLHWEAALMVNNLTDERVGIQGFDLATLCGCNEVSFKPPRWYGINLRYSF